jgi:hypothetical protein
VAKIRTSSLAKYVQRLDFPGRREAVPLIELSSNLSQSLPEYLLYAVHQAAQDKLDR